MNKWIAASVGLAVGAIGGHVAHRAARGVYSACHAQQYQYRSCLQMKGSSAIECVNAALERADIACSKSSPTSRVIMDMDYYPVVGVLGLAGAAIGYKLAG